MLFSDREKTLTPKIGVYSKSLKIFSYPKTRDRLHMVIVQSQEGNSFAYYGTNFEIRNVSEDLNESAQHVKRLSNYVEFDSLLHRIDPHCTPIYYAALKISFELVVVREQKQHINLLEPQAIIQISQHFLPHLQNLNVLQKSDITTIVQYVKKTRGLQVNTPLLQDVVSNENGISKQSDTQGRSYSGKIKYSCRSSVSKHNTTHRVDTEQPNSLISVYNVGRTNNRFV
ncbi:unnamed protein product [Mytilus coruscus]|uniref:Uncharacterized protein n=1 Tax=Mytilus coruscus TaxID=42192 RepID=A0A6J8CW69_MYTCO|nr:unnamed protein product [Mytilus coruscus]